MDQEVAIEYLNWLSNLADGQEQYFIWDVYPAHRSEAVKDAAVKANIQLSFVPNGQTATWQPLDCRVFGSLKARAKGRFNAAVTASLFTGEQPEWGMNDALVMLAEVWRAMPEEETGDAWSCLD